MKNNDINLIIIKSNDFKQRKYQIFDTLNIERFI